MPVECASPVIPPGRLSLGIEGRLAPRLNREQPRQNSGARPLIVSSLSPRSFYGEASSTIAVRITMIYVAILARAQAPREEGRDSKGKPPLCRDRAGISASFPHPSIVRGAHKSARVRDFARIHYPWLCVHRRDRRRERHVFTREIA